MRILVLYDSKVPETRVVAERIATRTLADLKEIGETAHASNSPTAEINAHRSSLEDYDLAFIGTSVLEDNIASEIQEHLPQLAACSRGVALFCTTDGSDGSRSLASIRRLLPDAKVFGQLGVQVQTLEDESALEARLDEWIGAVRALYRY